MRSLQLALLLSTSLFAGTMHNGEVLKMVRSGMSVVQIVDQINSMQSSFALHPEDVKSLQEDGVPEIVIQAMFAKNMNKALSLSAFAAQPEMAVNNTTPAPVASPATAPVITNPSPSMGGLKESDQWFLKPGRAEMIGRFGANFGPDRRNAIQMSANTELGIGITRWISGLGGYGYNRVGSFSTVKADFEEVMGGVRVAAPRRFSPYGVGTAGVVRAKLGSDLYGGYLAGYETKAAFAGGGGFNFGINKNVGAVVDFRFVKPIEFNWYARTTAGIYIRFQ